MARTGIRCQMKYDSQITLVTNDIIFTPITKTTHASCSTKYHYNTQFTPPDRTRQNFFVALRPRRRCELGISQRDDHLTNGFVDSIYLFVYLK